MRVLFVDVGQGTCQVVLLGNQRAIVIDGGASPETAQRILRLRRIEIIELLIVTHSHLDHSGGIASRGWHHNRPSASTGILVDYCRAIERIGFVYDTGLKNSAFGQLLLHQLGDGSLQKEQLFYVSIDGQPQQIWPTDPNQELTHLVALSPCAAENFVANVQGNPNATSLILELRHRGDRILFGSDSSYSQWREAVRLNGGPMRCKAIAMPHHGGSMGDSETDFDWFHQEAIEAEVSIFSVGTNNNYGHPERRVVAVRAAQGSHVMCTQITPQCCGSLESIRPGIIGPMNAPCRSRSVSDLTRSGNSRNVACAGTIVANLTTTGIEIARIEEHRRGVDRLVESGNSPLCRPQLRSEVQ